MISYDDFVTSSKKFLEISDSICDNWKLCKCEKQPHMLYLKKDCFVEIQSERAPRLLKAEYVVSYSTSYSVPTFAFNIWESSGALLSLEDIREMCLLDISKEDFYSVITQQEHPLLFRPYFMVHPCHTGQMLSTFERHSKNLLVTFITFVSPLVRLKLPLEYGV